MKNYLPKSTQAATKDASSVAPEVNPNSRRARSRRDAPTISVSEMVVEAEKFIWGQTAAATALANQFHLRAHAAQLLKAGYAVEEIFRPQPVLMIGPTGCGKSALVNRMARIAGVELVEANAPEYITIGARGGKEPSEILGMALDIVGGSLDPMKTPTVALDEVDKLAARGETGSVASIVQNKFLKVMEDMPCVVFSGGRKTRIRSSDFSWVFLGAFSGLEEIIRRRKNQTTLGFQGSLIQKPEAGDNDIRRSITAADMIDFGFSAEFVARLGKPIFLNPLDASALKKIAQLETSIIAVLKRHFADFGILLEVSEAALDLIAHEAAQLKLGVRGLRNIVETSFAPLLARIDQMAGVQRVIVDSRTLRGEEPPVFLMGPPLVKPRPTMVESVEDQFGLTSELRSLFPPGSIPRRPSRYNASAAGGNGRLARIQDLRQLGIITPLKRAA